MFQKVLVCDDLDSITYGVQAILDNFGISDSQKVHYCDDAWLRLQKAEIDGEPFDLFVTDLSFKNDHRPQKFTSGEALVEEVKQKFPNLKVIVYSVEDKVQKARTLIKKFGVDAYVCKGRSGLKELESAIKSAAQNTLFVSESMRQALQQKSLLEIDDFDILLLKELANGYSQEEISTRFKSQNIKPASLSSIEKRLNKLKIQFKASNAVQLIAVTKDIGLI